MSSGTNNFSLPSPGFPISVSKMCEWCNPFLQLCNTFRSYRTHLYSVKIQSQFEIQSNEIPMRIFSQQPKMIRQLADGYSVRPLKNKLYTHENVKKGNWKKGYTINSFGFYDCLEYALVLLCCHCSYSATHQIDSCHWKTRQWPAQGSSNSPEIVFRLKLIFPDKN